MKKKSKGNMYDWVTHTHTHLGGECPHKCKYCYVQRNRFGVSPRYQGELRLIEKEFEVPYRKGEVIFIEHMNDMFAEDMPLVFIEKILSHCRRNSEAEYVFQTKNPENAFSNIGLFPKKYIIGTTIESNREYPEISNAPTPESRNWGIEKFKKKFITIEPILDFDVEEFVAMIIIAKPDFINIGADSKHCNLPEPTPEKIKLFIEILQEANINIRKKSNLERFLK